jgi:hypothetical protein
MASRDALAMLHEVIVMTGEAIENSKESIEGPQPDCVGEMSCTAARLTFSRSDATLIAPFVATGFPAPLSLSSVDTDNRLRLCALQPLSEANNAPFLKVSKSMSFAVPLLK